MEKQIMQVGEFQRAFGVELPKRPTLLLKERAVLRHKLLKEEVKEIEIAEKAKDIVSVADGIVDSMYILIGTAHEYGFADRLVMLFDEVHRSNMTKMGEDGYAIFREDGKVMKPDTYSPPKLARILSRDFSVYTENETIKEIHRQHKEATEKKIRNKIYKSLGFIDKILLIINEKTESRLQKKVEVNFPISQGNIQVIVNGKTHEVTED
jgi:predicted HAD superfamily Cof-like phosphohydrolase